WRVQKILKRGTNKKVGMFDIRLLPNKKAYNRFAIVISRKFSKLAVTRNLKRRQIYESIRHASVDTTMQCFDIVLIPKKQILTCNYEEIYHNVKDALTTIKN
ncbi:ribonuclease P protein component, partial [Patescibacteria group bacterium]|nr:ribonuclease P protein component [Patescibacteria group bacterium]